MMANTVNQKPATYQQTTIQTMVDKALGKDKTKPDVVYEFTGRKFYEYPGVNPYTHTS